VPLLSSWRFSSTAVYFYPLAPAITFSLWFYARSPPYLCPPHLKRISVPFSLFVILVCSFSVVSLSLFYVFNYFILVVAPCPLISIDGDVNILIDPDRLLAPLHFPWTAFLTKEQKVPLCSESRLSQYQFRLNSPLSFLWPPLFFLGFF